MLSPNAVAPEPAEYPEVLPLGHTVPHDVTLAAAALPTRRRTAKQGVSDATAPSTVAGSSRQHDLGSSGGSSGSKGVLRLENYIPVRYPELRDKLVESNPGLFPDACSRAKFYRLAMQMSMRNQVRLGQAFRPLLERYSFLDPDVDSSLPHLTGDDLTREERAILAAEFEAGMHQLLLRGGFEELRDEQLKASLADVGVTHGLAVKPPDPTTVYFKLFFRGRRLKELRYRSWRTLYLARSVQVPVLQRLVILFRARTESGAAVLGREDSGSGWFRRVFVEPFNRRVIRVAEETVSARWSYLKLFKEIEVSDIDMLLPGSVVRFTLLDWVIICAPVLVGLVGAIVKAAQGTLNFSSLANTISSLALVVVPITWALRAYLAVADKQRAYVAHLNKVFLLHNLNNNSGVCTQTLEEAREQEDKEAILAYTFLLQKSPAAMTLSDLDRTVEGWVNTQLTGPAGSSCSGGGKHSTAEKKKTRAGPQIAVDFQVKGAVEKLVALKVAKQVAAGRGSGDVLYAAVGLDEALAAANLVDLNSAAALSYPTGLLSEAQLQRSASTVAGDEEPGSLSALYPPVDSRGLEYFSPVASAKQAAADLAQAAQQQLSLSGTDLQPIPVGRHPPVPLGSLRWGNTGTAG